MQTVDFSIKFTMIFFGKVGALCAIGKIFPDYECAGKGLMTSFTFYILVHHAANLEIINFINVEDSLGILETNTQE
jgi:hypothetical protein